MVPPSSTFVVMPPCPRMALYPPGPRFSSIREQGWHCPVVFKQHLPDTELFVFERQQINSFHYNIAPGITRVYAFFSQHRGYAHQMFMLYDCYLPFAGFCAPVVVAFQAFTGYYFYFFHYFHRTFPFRAYTEPNHRATLRQDYSATSSSQVLPYSLSFTGISFTPAKLDEKFFNSNI